MKHQYLTVLSPKAVVCQVKGIELCLGPSAVALTIPLNAAECLKLSLAALAGDRLFSRMAFNSPAVHLRLPLGGYAQLLSMVIADPSCQF